MSELATQNTPPNTSAENPWMEEDEISLLDLATTLGEEKKLIFGLPAIAAVVSIVASLLIPNVYTAKTTLLPPSGNGGGGAAAALAALGSLGGLAGGLGGIKTPDEQYVAMLKSRSVRDILVEQYDLKNRYEAKTIDDVYMGLDKAVQISSDKKSGMLTVAVDDEDPKFASELANAHATALKEVLDRVAVTEAQLRRKFFEEQFAKAKEDLSKAEVALKEVQKTSGLIELKEQAKASIEASAAIRAQIAQREVQLTAMRSFATAQNPDYVRIAGELSGLRIQLKKLEQGGGKDDDYLATKDLPETGLTYVRALREVKYFEAIFEIMAKQFELAKIEESKEGTGLQQLDKATPPERKSKPKRAIIVVVSTLAAGFLAVLIALLRGAMRKANQDPENRSKFAQLKKAWGLKT